MTAAPAVHVVHGEGFDLSRRGLAVPAPLTRRRLDEWCRAWAQEVGWRLADRPGEADGIVVGPGAGPGTGAAPATPGQGVAGADHRPVVPVVPGRGVDGYRWAIHSLAWRVGWPPETVSYGDAPDQVADVRRPAGAAAGVAVLLHGGFWLEPWRRDLLDGVAVDLARRGWLSCNVEYRRLGTGGGWPQTGADVLAALDRFAGTGAIVVGHSVGATLGLWAARRRAVAGVVALAGVCDLAEAARGRLAGPAVRRFLAGADPAVLSPLAHEPPDAPVVLAHAPGDALVPSTHSLRYARHARARGARLREVEVAGADHFSLLVPAGDWAAVARHLPPSAPERRSPHRGSVDTPGHDI